MVSSELVLALYSADYPKGQKKGYVGWNPDKRTAKRHTDIEDVLVRYCEYWPLGPRQVGYVLIGGYGPPRPLRTGNLVPTTAGIRQVLCLKVKVKLVPLAVVVKAPLETRVWVETSFNRDGLWKPRY